MEKMDKMQIDIDELAKKIEKRIAELEEKQKEEYKDEKLGETITNLDEIIKEIDKKIKELEEEEEENISLDINGLTNKVNDKLALLDEVNEEDLGKTIYDLEEISKTINNTISELEKKRKEKKKKKKMYCDMARKNKNKKNY